MSKKGILIPKTKDELRYIIHEEMAQNGESCDLNHIDVSLMNDLSFLFNSHEFQKFNGDISNWNVSNVTNMSYMFQESYFEGDISNWNVSSVIYMKNMFPSSRFNGDISQWNVSNVENMDNMFCGSLFNRDISKWDVSNVRTMANIFPESAFQQDLNNWKPIKAVVVKGAFEDCEAPTPYWAKIDDFDLRVRAINATVMREGLDSKLELKKEKNKIKI